MKWQKFLATEDPAALALEPIGSHVAELMGASSIDELWDADLYPQWEKARELDDASRHDIARALASSLHDKYWSIARPPPDPPDPDPPDSDPDSDPDVNPDR